MEKLMSWIATVATGTIWCVKWVKGWLLSSTFLVTIATCVIAWYAYENHNLANETKTANEYYQQKTTDVLEKMNEILKETNRIILLIESSKTERRLQKELDAELQKVNPHKRMTTGH